MQNRALHRPYITYVSANVKAIGAVPMFTLYPDGLQRRRKLSFMAKLGADKADFIAAQTSDRDAGCFEVASPVPECAGRGNGPFYWDESNVATPNFSQSLAQWSTVRSLVGNLPILFWQTPLRVPSATPGGSPGHYRDNRVHYMLTEYTAIGVFAIVFSGGGSPSANITTDGGQFARLFQAYLANPAPFPH